MEQRYENMERRTEDAANSLFASLQACSQGDLCMSLVARDPRRGCIPNLVNSFRTALPLNKDSRVLTLEHPNFFLWFSIPVSTHAHKHARARQRTNTEAHTHIHTHTHTHTQLGSGGFGTVFRGRYEAKHGTKERKEVAIKILNKEPQAVQADLFLEFYMSKFLHSAHEHGEEHWRELLPKSPVCQAVIVFDRDIDGKRENVLVSELVSTDLSKILKTNDLSLRLKKVMSGRCVLFPACSY